LATFLTALTEEEVEVMAMQPGSDGDFAEDIAAKVGGACFDLRKTFGSPLISMLAHASMVVSYRLHGVILAAAYGVPALGIAYDPKVSSFCSEMGFPFITPAEAHTTTALRKVEELWQNRETVKRTLENRRGSALERLRRVEARFGEMMWGAP
jgi:polysaccharide pyruvyl transferase WcaK-like protein